MLEGNSSTDELKRVDHLIFVTLKYTRTVDIIRNVIKRLQSALNYQIMDVVEWAHSEGKVDKVPTASLLRVRYLEKVFPKDKEVKDIADFYMMMRDILTSDYKKKEEYRKNVALVTKDHEISIDKLKELAEKTKNYIYYLKELIE